MSPPQSMLVKVMKTHVTALDRKTNILDAMVIASSVYLIIRSEPALSNLICNH